MTVPILLLWVAWIFFTGAVFAAKLYRVLQNKKHHREETDLEESKIFTKCFFLAAAGSSIIMVLFAVNYAIYYA
jgi:flagellar biosynthesis protein FlhB